MILRELAAGWVRANCPRSDVQADFLQYLDGAIQSRVNCSFMIGQKLINSGKPFLIWCFCGEFFAFELAPQQAARLQVADSLLICARGVREYDQRPSVAPIVSLEQVEVNQAAGARPIIADCRNAAIPDGPVYSRAFGDPSYLRASRPTKLHPLPPLVQPSAAGRNSAVLGGPVWRVA